MSQAQHQPPKGPPYAPQIWQLGGKPSKGVDIPVTVVFLVLFIISAAAHMTIFQKNRGKGHKFLFSAILFGFSMSRIVTTTMRIASVSLPDDVQLAMAAQILQNAGVVLVFIVNLVFTERMVRAAHPKIGWSNIFRVVLYSLITMVVMAIIMLITVIVLQFYTLNAHIREICRSVILTGITYFAVISFLPIPIVAALAIFPHKKLDKFGEGRWRTKIAVLLVSSILISFGAIYRAAVNWQDPIPFSKPMPSYLSKGAFYVAYFGVEIIVLFLYAFIRIDRRFHIPNGAHGAGSYGKTSQQGISQDQLHVYPEEEAFGQNETDEVSKDEEKEFHFPRSPVCPQTPKSSYSRPQTSNAAMAEADEGEFHFPRSPLCPQSTDSSSHTRQLSSSHTRQLSSSHIRQSSSVTRL